MSVRGPKVKWLNYKTGVKDIYFRLSADKRSASVAIEIQHKDAGLRELFYEQFEELQLLIHSTTETEWIWEREYYNEAGVPMCRIWVELEGANIYEKDDWGKIFRFFKKHLVALDEVWGDAIEIFQDLAE